ncbi:MAG: hypothetical protein ACE5JQ_13265 [Candidatus Methylomirabilales bacterium]
MERWRLYWHVAELQGRFEVVGAGVARPEQEFPEGAMQIECPGGKEESIWLYRAVRTQLTGRSFAFPEEASQAVRCVLSELQRAAS